jgi:acetyltransferase-like isoleucine patch superfamily enzyme
MDQYARDGRDEATIFVHSLGLCESSAVGPGTRVWAFAHVMDGAVVGALCNICDHAFVESGARLGDNVTVKNAVLIWSGVTIEDDVFLGPACCFTNDLRPRSKNKKAAEDLIPTTVRRGATIGANATIVCGCEVGAHAFVAAGSVVARDVAAHALAAGVPARRIGWVCECGERLGDDLVCSCGNRYELIDERRGLRPARGSTRAALQ